MGTPRHATLDVGDIDGDGDIDIVVGNFSVDKAGPAADRCLDESAEAAVGA